MAVLNKAWGSMDALPSTETTAVTGEDEEGTADAAPRLLSKPLFIYVTDGADLGATDKIEKVVLMDDKVCIGMWAFDCVKMSPEKVKEDPVLAEEWSDKDDRGFIFVSRDKSKIDVVNMKKMSSKNVFKTMNKFATKAYKTNFETNVKAILKVLTDFDKINNQRRVLADKEARASEKEDKQALKDIAKDREALDKEEKAANEKRDELLKFELKEAKAA